MTSHFIAPLSTDTSLLKLLPSIVSLEATTVPEKTNWVIAFFCILVAFGGFVFGFDTGTISGFLNMSDFLRRFGVPNAEGIFHLSDIRTGLIVSIFNIGCAVGGIFLSKIGDIHGRRSAIVSAMAIYVIGVTVQISSNTAWYQVCIGRAITGLAVGIVAVLCPLFIGESAPKRLRGTFVYCFQFFITAGIFLGYLITFATKSYSDHRQWTVPMGLNYLWAIILIASMAFMPESARFLVTKGKVDEAKKSLARCNNTTVDSHIVTDEIELIQAGIQVEELAGSASWKELVNGQPSIFRRVCLGICLQALQQLSGCNYFFYYGTTIFQSVGMEDSFACSIILGAVNFASTFVGVYAIDKVGRRVCLLSGSCLMFVCLVIFSSIGSFALYKVDKDFTNDNTRPSVGYGMVFVTCIYIFGFATTWAGGVFAIVSESYPLRIRSKAMSVASASNWVMGFLIAFLTPVITSTIHFSYGFVFAGFMLISIVYVFFFVHETKGLSLEEVDEMYSLGVSARGSIAWVPKGAEAAEIA